MVTFKVLDIRKILKARIGIYTNNLVDSTLDFFKSYANYHAMFIVITFSVTSSGLFIYENLSQYSLVIETASILIAGFQCIGLLLSIGLNEKKVRDLHRSLQDIVNENNADDVHDIYWKCEQKCQKLVNTISAFIYCSLAIYPISFFVSIYYILIGNFDISTWPFSLNLSLPFNTNTLWGYYLRLIIEFNMGYTYCSGMITVRSLFVSSCIYIVAICDHFDFEICSTNEDVRLIDKEKNPRKYNEIVRKLQKKLSKSVAIHNKILKIFDIVADINSLGIFSLLPLNAIVFAMMLYTNEHSNLNVVAIIFNAAFSCAGMLWPSLHCTYATFVTDRISSIGFVAYDAHWYAYPVKLQKYQILMMAHSQKPVYFTGLGLVYCTLEYFGKLLKGSCSYYVIFRGLSQH